MATSCTEIGTPAERTSSMSKSHIYHYIQIKIQDARYKIKDRDYTHTPTFIQMHITFQFGQSCRNQKPLKRTAWGAGEEERK